MSELNLNKVIFVPAYEPPLKNKEELLPAKLRLKLLKAALRREPHFSVSLCEMKRKGVSYTVDTLKFFRKKFGKNQKLFFICGADHLKNLSCWKSPEKIFKLCHFVVATRPGFRVKKLPARALYMPFDALPISSTLIRKEWREKSSKPLKKLN